MRVEVSDDETLKNCPYLNTISADGKYIFESRKSEHKKFAEEILENFYNDIRIVFPKYQRLNGYIFRGVFELDIELTKKTLGTGENKAVWRKISDRIELEKYFK